MHAGVGLARATIERIGRGFSWLTLVAIHSHADQLAGAVVECELQADQAAEYGVNPLAPNEGGTKLRSLGQIQEKICAVQISDGQPTWTACQCDDLAAPFLHEAAAARQQLACLRIREPVVGRYG